MNSKKSQKIKRFLTTLGISLFLLAFCVGLSFLLTLPLWKWATSSSVSYSIAILLAIALFVAWKIFQKIRRKAFSCRRKHKNES